MQFATPAKPADQPTTPVVAWEEAPCPLCASRHGTPLVEAQDHSAGEAGLWFAVVQCDSCGLCFTNPRPDSASIGQFYPSKPKHQPPPRRRWAPWQWLKRPRIEHPAIAWHGQGRLLDIGCGNGAYLREMHRQGWKVTGLDASSRMVDRVRDELGLPALVGTLPHLDLEPESFDVVTMWHALERVHDPMPMLREARHLLAPGGRLFISVPNIDSLPFRVFGRHWIGLDLPRRLTHFTPGSLALMLQRCGFATEPIRHLCRADWLRESARRAGGTNAWQRSLRYRVPAWVAAWYNCNTAQSDCILAVAHR